MNGEFLRFYTHENHRVAGVLVYEWLLDQAKRLGIHGGTAFKAMAGFGRHGRLHEQHFFELAGDVPVLVEFIADEAAADALIAALRSENVNLFFARLPAEFDAIEPAQT